jgi:hypothetical protein
VRNGILIAANGISGEPGAYEAAYAEIAVAAREGIHILVLTRAELEACLCPAHVIEHLKTNILEITLKQTRMR